MEGHLCQQDFSTDIYSLEHGIVPPEQVQAPSLANVLKACDQIKHHVLLHSDPYVSHVSQSNPQAHKPSHNGVWQRKRIMRNLMNNHNNNDMRTLLITRQEQQQHQMVVVVGQTEKGFDHS